MRQDLLYILAVGYQVLLKSKCTGSPVELLPRLGAVVRLTTGSHMVAPSATWPKDRSDVEPH